MVRPLCQGTIRPDRLMLVDDFDQQPAHLGEMLGHKRSGQSGIPVSNRRIDRLVLLKNHGRCPCRNRTAPTGLTPPELKMDCHLGKPKSRVVNLDWSVEAIDVILATPIRVRRCCARRQTPAVGLRSRGNRIISVTGRASAAIICRPPSTFI